MTRYLWLLLLCWPSLIVTAQDLSVWFERGHAAYEDGRYEEAEQAFRWIVDHERKNAEGHYMLARVLLARDMPKKAARSITRAIRYDPDNVHYLELQYQIGLPNEFLRPIREVKKRELAAKILALDAGSVTANVALGYSEAQVYLNHRNRITIHGLWPYSNGFGRARAGSGIGDRASLRPSALGGEPKIPSRAILLTWNNRRRSGRPLRISAALPNEPTPAPSTTCSVP